MSSTDSKEKTDLIENSDDGPQTSTGSQQDAKTQLYKKLISKLTKEELETKLISQKEANQTKQKELEQCLKKEREQFDKERKQYSEEIARLKRENQRLRTESDVIVKQPYLPTNICRFSYIFNIFIFIIILITTNNKKRILFF